MLLVPTEPAEKILEQPFPHPLCHLVEASLLNCTPQLWQWQWDVQADTLWFIVIQIAQFIRSGGGGVNYGNNNHRDVGVVRMPGGRMMVSRCIMSNVIIRLYIQHVHNF